MTDLRERLVECFTAVFPDLSPDEAVAATADTVANWDSEHHFTLMQVIEEAFSIRIPPDVLGEIDSFNGFERYVTQAKAASWA